MGVHSRQISEFIILENAIYNEVPSGDINSVNKVFTLAHIPEGVSVELHLNGMLQRPGASYDYTISGATITFSKAPRTGSEILAHYLKEDI